MTQEEKQLLLKDLCARLPYGVICEVEFKDNESWKQMNMILEGVFTNECYFTTESGSIYSREFKPYLRPMSKMTKKEREEYRKFSYYGAVGIRNKDFTDTVAVPSFEKLDYLNSHHFDYRGLIEKGLALEASEGMYNIKIK